MFPVTLVILVQDFLEHDLFQLYPFYDSKNLTMHFFPDELSFEINDDNIFLISAILNKPDQILTQNLWIFQIDLNVLMTHPILRAILQQPCL